MYHKRVLWCAILVMGLDWRVIGRGRSVTARFACSIIFGICIMSGLVQMTEKEMKKRAKQKRQMLLLQQQELKRAVEKAKEKQDDWVMVKRASAIDMIEDAMKRKKGGKRKTRKHKKKHRRKTKRKRRVKRRRRTRRR